uniref:Copper resistance protein n=1 Tax=Acidithiobacillus sulfuriphilus TaxID=1867749 RepID=A0A3M8RNC0_9PROT|nr:hypothetical protein EC580_02055 [Acidithiobacillus sulfuriphilus]
MQRIRRHFPLLALLAMFLLGTWMSNAAVAMPLGVSCAGMPSMPMADMPCCQGDPGMDMDPHSGAMPDQCMSICAEAHAPGGLRLPGMAFPAPVMMGSVTFSRLAMFRPAPVQVFFSHPPHHPPPLQHVRLVI